MPWIRLLKSHMVNGKRLPIGQVFKVDNDYMTRILNTGDAELYIGPLPPRKMKTDFFKPNK